jgi:pyridoxine 5-phosphate synthase
LNTSPSARPSWTRRSPAPEQAHAWAQEGHGLNYPNLPILHRVPHLVELNIGHSIISRSITVGLQAAVREMLGLMASYCA